jgi:hypothetical protein
MQIEIIGKKGRTLRSLNHGGQTYIEAPAQGEYKIRLRNTSGSRRCAVVSVDGVNVLDGKDAGFDGRGYVLRPWETIDIPGWMRSDSKVAKFEFKEQGGSYAAQTGRGTSNVGVIGVAVFDEKVQTYVPKYSPYNTNPSFVPWYPNPYPTNWNSTTYGADHIKSSAIRSSKSLEPNTLGSNPEEHARGMRMEQNTSGVLFDSSNVCSMDSMAQEMESGGRATKSAAPAAVMDVGTGYGHEASFYTETITFNRATSSPALVVSVRYATRERLVSWGVPIDSVTAPMAPNPFPSSMSSVPAPPGWRG